MGSSLFIPRTAALVMDGGESEAYVHGGAEALAAEVLPDAQRRTLEGQAPDVDPKVLAPVLAKFLAK